MDIGFFSTSARKVGTTSVSEVCRRNNIHCRHVRKTHRSNKAINDQKVLKLHKEINDCNLALTLINDFFTL